MEGQVRLSHEEYSSMASNLYFIQNAPGSHCWFLSQAEVSSDFCFKWLLWFLKREIWALRGQEGKQSHRPGVCCRGGDDGGEDSLPGEQDSFSLGWPSPSEPAVL